MQLEQIRQVKDQEPDFCSSKKACARVACKSTRPLVGDMDTNSTLVAVPARTYKMAQGLLSSHPVTQVTS